MGRPATGKSTIAEQLAWKLNITHYSSDRIRKTLAGLPLKKRTDPARRETLYSREMSQKTYATLLEKALNGIRQQKNSILDATYSKKEERDNLIEVLQDNGAGYYFIEAFASDEIIKKRLREREASQRNVSDARLEDFEKLDRYYEPPSAIDSEHLIRVDTEKSVENTLEQLHCNLIKRRLDIDG
jgi:predicted kinase